MATTKKGRNAKGQFEIGNSFSQKKWTTPEALQKDVDAYFKECDNHKKVEIVNGKLMEIPAPKPYTLEKLALHLDCDSETLKNYRTKKGYEPYFGIINKARLKVVSNMAERASMFESHASFTQFLMKNHFGYADKQEVEHSGDTIKVKRATKK